MPPDESDFSAISTVQVLIAGTCQIMGWILPNDLNCH